MNFRIFTEIIGIILLGISDLGFQARFQHLCPRFQLVADPSKPMDLICNDVKNKNGRDSWGTLYGSPMERLAFRYDGHEEIARYIRMWHVYYHPMVMRVLLTFKNFWLVLFFQTS